MALDTQPVDKSYWVIPNRFRAGEYPGSLNDDEACRKIRWLLGLDLCLFLDLTKEGEYGIKPYTALLVEEARKLNKPVQHRRIPIKDLSAPPQQAMVEILDAIDTSLSAGKNIYLHCLGGKGRTGTVVGCYLVRNGMAGDEALKMIMQLRKDISDDQRPSPETGSQRRMVEEWIKGR